MTDPTVGQHASKRSRMPLGVRLEVLGVTRFRAGEVVVPGECDGGAAHRNPTKNTKRHIAEPSATEA